MPSEFAFELLNECNETSARRGVVTTPHGTIRTPAFMPVGTAATIKGLTPGQAKTTDSDILLCNTYHLTLRPGEKIVKELGGLHEFMQWDGPILTDSGGYQVFSLGELTRVDDSGVTFKNHIDGQQLRLSPERALEIQRALGSDIMMVFDECLPHDSSEEAVRKSLETRTTPWAERSLDHHPRDGRALFAIGQGGLFEDLRREHMQHLSKMPFDGFAIGGLSVGESANELRAMVAASTPHMPTQKPRYLMGVGSIPEIIDSVALGIDMFDCVLPSRNARNGQAFTFEGPLRLKNSRFINDGSVIDPECPCIACAGGFSRAYIRHLLQAKEMLSSTLMTHHNLSFMQRVMARLRDALALGHFAQTRNELLAAYQATPPSTSK